MLAEDDVRGRADGYAHPVAGHPQMRENLGAVVEVEAQPLPPPLDALEGSADDRARERPR